jgi:hypothetical protein
MYFCSGKPMYFYSGVDTAGIAVGRWDKEPLKNALLKQSNDARGGLVCVAVGAGFQIVSKLIEEFIA